MNEIKLTESQTSVLKQLEDFVFKSDDKVFLLKGHAGTGKTTLVRFLIEELKKKERGFKLLASTGRASAVLARYTEEEARTIHGLIYRYSSFNKDVSKIDEKNADETGQLLLQFEPTHSPIGSKSCIYIVDESSMISDVEDKNPTQAKFGSGRLLKELLDYDKNPQSKFIFVGDPCQLPPVFGTFSPALSQRYFVESFHLVPQLAELTEVMRSDNSIAMAGQYVRELWQEAPQDDSCYPVGRTMWGPRLRLSPFADIHIVGNLQQMEMQYLLNIRDNGYKDSVFICPSNTKCSETSKRFRHLLGFSGSVQKGDLLMVMQNQITTGLMNGDMVEVVDVNPDVSYTFSRVDKSGCSTNLIFREINVKELFTDCVHNTLIIEDTLTGNQSNLDARQQTALFVDFILRMKDKGITEKDNKVAFDNAMQNDPYLNALRCSYGYAVTCHKSQGGEWNNVFVQPPRNITGNPTKEKYQWFYTAITRARKSVYLVDDFFID